MAVRTFLSLLSYTIGLLILTRTFPILVNREFRKPLHSVLGVTAFFTALWTFSYSIMYFTTDRSTAMTAYRWGSFGWTTGFSAVTIFFNMLFSSIRGKKINVPVNTAILAIGIVFNAAAFEGQIVAADFEAVSWGWREIVDSRSLWVLAYGIFIMAAMFNVIFRAIITWRSVHLNRQRRQMQMIGIPFAALSIPTAIVNYIAPVLGIIAVPPVGHIVLGCVMLFICHSVVKYRMLDFDPTYVGTHLLFGVSDYVFLTDAGGYITRTGNAARDVLGLDPDEIAGTHISVLSPELKTEWLNENFGLDAPVTTSIVTYDGTSVPVSCSVMRVLDTHDDPMGFLLVMSDLRAIRKLENTTEELKKTNELLKHISVTDPLTGAFNRKKMNEELEREFWRFHRSGVLFSIIMFDIDNFKKINDTIGHAAGDEVLRKVTAITQGLIRRMDTLARWGGEEFLVLCVESKEEDAANLAERIRSAFAEGDELFEGQRVTASFGVAGIKDALSIENLLHYADRAMYRSKDNGRNLVTVYRQM